MRQTPKTSPETDRCLDLIYELGSVEISDFRVEAGFQTVTLTGRAGSWLARQLDD